MLALVNGIWRPLGARKEQAPEKPVPALSIPVRPTDVPALRALVAKAPPISMSPSESRDGEWELFGPPEVVAEFLPRLHQWERACEQREAW